MENLAYTAVLFQLKDVIPELLKMIDERGGWNEDLARRFQEKMQREEELRIMSRLDPKP